MALEIEDYNIYVVIMIPILVPLAGAPWDVLPPGIHDADLAEISAAFAYNQRRRDLLLGFELAAAALSQAGCSKVYLDGSFVTAKPIPRDYDACWDTSGVDPTILDPVFRDFSNGRAAQKAKFSGEFFPAQLVEASVRKTFLEFLQLERFTGMPKGIISISLTNAPMRAGGHP